MARPLRIEYEGAWYHVMNRGANRQPIFKTNEDRLLFLSILENVVKLYFIEIHAYCLMDNHYHLLIRSPYANLAKAMRYLNGVYTQQYNRTLKRDGALFRGRYKAILIEEEQYLLNVSRYIHLNPTSAKICERPSQYRWSSYRAYIGKSKNAWLTTQFVLTQVGGSLGYAEFVFLGIDKEIEKFYGKKILSPILGTKDFKKRALTKVNKQKLEASRPDLNRTKQLPEIDFVIKVITTYFKISREFLQKTIRGQLNLPRLFAIYLSRSFGLHAYSKISVYFDMGIDGVRSAIRRFEQMRKTDNHINETLNELIKLLHEAQPALTPSSFILSELGITPTQAITMLYTRIARAHEWPLELKIPNAKTAKAIKEARKGKGVVVCKDKDDLFKSLED